MLILAGLQPINSGLFRDCFVDPGDETKCVKIERVHADAAAVPLQPRLRPQRSPNELEYQEYLQLLKDKVPLALYRPCLYGFVETDLGRGLSMDLLLNDDGTPPVSLETYLTGQHNLPDLPHDSIRSDYAAFAAFCIRYAIFASSDELSNVGYIYRNGSYRFIVFDMKRRQNRELIPVSSYIPYFRRKKVRRRFVRSQAELEKRLAALQTDAILSR